MRIAGLLAFLLVVGIVAVPIFAVFAVGILIWVLLLKWGYEYFYERD